MDRREDAGDFYPGGKTISTRPVATGGDMKHSEFAEMEPLPERFTENQMRTKLNAVIGLLKGSAATLVVFAALAALGDALTVQKAPKGDIYNDEPVVTNIVVDASITNAAPASKTVEINTGSGATNLVVRPVYANVNLVIRECETANGNKQYRLIKKEN